jgi:hypothetical protein
VALLVTLLHHAPLLAWNGFLYVDALGGFFLLTVSGVTLLAGLARSATWGRRSSGAS